MLNVASTGTFAILALIVNLNDMHAKMNVIAGIKLLFWAQCRYTKIAQRMFKYSDIQYTSLTTDKILNSLIYRTLFYVNTHGSRGLQTCKKSPAFLAHPVVVEVFIAYLLNLIILICYYACSLLHYLLHIANNMATCTVSWSIGHDRQEI